MTLRKKGQHWFGDDHADLREEILSYSQANSYPAEHFANALCSACGNDLFRTFLDDTEGCAVRVCVSCQSKHFIGDSAEFADEANLEECACPCGKEIFQISVGVHLYPDSEDVKWLYLGLRCSSCGLSAVYGDWKNEYQDYRNLLALV
ncbi:MAG TPA: hypothetical protein VGS07_17445 [Thermoanaerobaculia bacterium]|nr:hypothetical protein [Thermoanaerobaculia bacterium]